VAPNISALRAFVNSPTLTAKAAVKAAIMASFTASLAEKYKPTIGPMSSRAEMAVVIMATATATVFSLNRPM
jgi:hypothetical protein